MCLRDIVNEVHMNEKELVWALMNMYVAVNEYALQERQWCPLVDNFRKC